MGRWYKSGRMLKTNLAAGGVAALLLLAACGDEDAKGDAESQTEATPVAAIDPAQAPIIQKGIEDYLLVMEGPADSRVMHHAAVKVTPGSDAFDVAIEGIRIGIKESDHLDVGTVTYRLTPKGTDGYIASDLKHAASFPHRGADGKEQGSLSLVTKSFTGEWSSGLQTLLALDWQASDIVAKDNAADGGDMKAGSVIASVTSTDKGNGVFDQTGLMTLSGFTAKDTTGGVMAFDKLSGKFALNGVKLKEYVSKTREMQSLMAEVADRAAANEAAAAASPDTAPVAVTPALSPEEAQKLGGLIKSMSGLVSGVTYDFDFENVSSKEADGSEPFRLKTGWFDLGFAGLDSEKASINIGMGHDGMVIKDPEITATPLMEKLLPASGNLALTLSDMPSKELWNLIGDQFPGLIAGDQNQAEAAFNVMLMAVGELLQKSPMKLNVGPSGLASEALQLAASGAFDVKPEAVFGLIGALDVDVHGLDGAMQVATEAAQTSAEAAQIVGGLAMIQSLAKRETTSDGKPVDKLKIEVDAMGDTKVNGVSLSGM
jgi:hypothetical protein